MIYVLFCTAHMLQTVQEHSQRRLEGSAAMWCINVIKGHIHGRLVSRLLVLVIVRPQNENSKFGSIKRQCM